MNPQIEMIAVSDLTPYARNSRTHSAAQVEQIAASIKAFGFTNPVLVDADNGIIAGHGRIAGAKSAGIDTVPCLRLADLTKQQIKAYIIADNKLAENAGWDFDILAAEIDELNDDGFDLELLGFSQEELSNLIGTPETGGLTDEDAVPDVPEEPVTKLGDVWILGRHRLCCGSSTDEATVKGVLNGCIPDLLFTDPPYGISIVSKNKVGGGGVTKFGKVGGGKDGRGYKLCGVSE